MKESTTELVEKFASDNENWYIDTYDSYTEVGMASKQNFSGFLAALEDRDIEYQVTSSVDKPNIVEVYR